MKYVRPEQVGLPMWHLVKSKSEILSHWSVVVCVTALFNYFNEFTIFVILNINDHMIGDSNRQWPNVDTKRSARVPHAKSNCCPCPLKYWPPKRQCGVGGGEYWKESIGRMLSVSVTLLIILKMLRLDKRYNSLHDTNLFLSNLDHPKIKMSSEHLFLTWSLSL